MKPSKFLPIRYVQKKNNRTRFKKGSLSHWIVANGTVLLFPNSSDDFAASQFGAVFFTHEAGSVLDGTETSYNESVVEQCLQLDSDYTSDDVCMRLGGYGYVIQYNFTAMHVSPLFQALADEALVRRHLNTDEFKGLVKAAEQRILFIRFGNHSNLKLH